MKKFIEKVPLPSASMMLAFATLGNMLADISFFRPLFGSIAVIILLALILKLALLPNAFFKQLDNSIVASVFCTFSMGIIVLSTYLVPFNKSLAFIIWWTGLFLHLFMTIRILVKYFSILKSRFIPASFYVPFVGYVAASVTCGPFGMENFGIILAVIGTVLCITLTPFILNTARKKGGIPSSVRPTLAIIAAPASLCLLGYLNSTSTPLAPLVLFLFVFALILSFIGFFYIISTISTNFNPTYAAYTFSTAISAFAMKRVSVYFMQNDNNLAKLAMIIWKIELALALLALIGVFFLTLLFVFKKETSIPVVS